MNIKNQIIEDNIEIMKQMKTLLASLTDKEYQDNQYPPYQSGIGKHIRHILDYYNLFLDNYSNKVDYEARMRNLRCEKEIFFSNKTIDDTIEKLKKLANIDIDKTEITINLNEGTENSKEVSDCRTNMKRELQFLSFHAIHHFSMIGNILYEQNKEIPQYFGYAPSTVRYNETLNI